MDGLAVGSLVVAVFALVWTIYIDRARRADARHERDARRDQLAREEGRRDEEIRLLRIQVEQQLATAQIAPAAAELVGRSTGYAGSSQGVTFPMSVRNVGSAVARDVRVWIGYAPVGQDPIPVPAVTDVAELGALVPNDPPSDFALTQGGVLAGGGVPRDGVIMASWGDDAGEHTDAIGRLTIFI